MCDAFQLAVLADSEGERAAKAHVLEAAGGLTKFVEYEKTPSPPMSTS